MINPRGAEIRQGNDHFYPPAREITFNENLTRNDGLLADAIAAKEEVGYEAAVKLIEKFNAGNIVKEISAPRNPKEFTLISTNHSGETMCPLAFGRNR